MKPLISLICLVLMAIAVEASPSDSIDTHHYDIHIDTLDYALGSLNAHTKLSFTSTQTGVQTARLDLLHLSIDSIKVGLQPTTWSYNDTLLIVNLPIALNVGDSASVTVWYHGKPKKDPSTFGGFYFVNSLQYAYNIGVGFDANPHNFGRVWYPCKDNFTDKAYYDYHIRVLNGRTAVCGGTLQNENDNGDGTTTFHWKLRDPIPTYLSSMAVADFTAIHDTFVSTSGDSIPVALYIRSSDSLGTTNSFKDLHKAFDEFENRWGPYRWERVGYVGVPFNAGAMEHATNIAYPNAFLNTGTAFETIMAHELAHAWFGNLVTCDEASEMWINEGLASYCEALYMDAVYGGTAYTDYIRDNHANVLRYTYIRDGGYLAVSGVGHNHTYGSTVYDKGALIGHTLRGYLGDADFFSGIQQFMSDYAFNNANSDTLKKVLAQVSGTNLDNFFTGWVKTPGFPHFQIDSIEVSPQGGQFQVSMHIRQRQKSTGIFLDDVKTNVTFMDSNWNSATKAITFSGPTAFLAVTLPFAPEIALFDLEEKMTDATIDNYHIFTTTSSHSFPQTYCNINPSAVPDSAFIRVVHNWVAPDDFKNPTAGIRLSDSRYWKIEGLMPAGFLANATFQYSAQVTSTPSLNPQAFLDHTWLNRPEDSLILFYRPNSGAEWEEVSSYTLNTGTLVDKKGTATLDTLRLGEYTFGIYDHSIVISVNPDPENQLPFTCYPNPTSGRLNLILPEPGNFQVKIQNFAGLILQSQELITHNRFAQLSLEGLPAGLYLINLAANDGRTSSVKIIRK